MDNPDWCVHFLIIKRKRNTNRKTNAKNAIHCRAHIQLWIEIKRPTMQSASKRTESQCHSMKRYQLKAHNTIQREQPTNLIRKSCCANNNTTDVTSRDYVSYIDQRETANSTMRWCACVSWLEYTKEKILIWLDLLSWVTINIESPAKYSICKGPNMLYVTIVNSVYASVLLFSHQVKCL